jgi:hypothetical protein
MKKIFLFTLLFCSHFLAISQNWTSEELQKANTAVNISSISSEEKEVIKYLNLARLYPQKFAIVEVKDYLGPLKYGDYLKTSAYKQSLLVELQNRTPVGLLFFDEGMFLLASCFAKESGEAGLVGHNRISCLKGFEGECCDYGHNEGKDIAISLLIDHDVPSLGHRKICLDESYNKVGASIKPHKTYGSCCVVDFKRKSNEYVNNARSQNKSNESTHYYQPTYNNEPTRTFETSKITKTKRHKLVSFKIGGSGNLLFDDVKNLNNSFSNQLSYQLNSMIGVNLGKSKKNTSIGLFGNYGKYNVNNTTLLSNSLFSSNSNFLEIEGGFLIKEFFRISGGLGYLSSNSINLSSNNYTTFSAGFSLGPKWLKFDIINTLVIPKNNQKVIYRPSLGLSFVLNFIKKKS